MCVARIEEMECEQNVGLKTWKKETTWETRRRWKDNIKIDLEEIDYEDV
jgi:hypothetical protein